jgi:peptidoglycan/LPS O-acetylase OafA/YrhL
MSDNAGARLPSLDGWRAISIALVIGGHSASVNGFPPELKTAFAWIFNGDLGVRTFFVISGLLITWLMLREQARAGRVNLKHFYARRALRILPVYFAFLAVVAALQWLTPFRQSAGQWLANLTFTTGLLNWGGGGSWTTGHLWSLAVEEQFYIIWPVVFAGLALASHWRRALGLLCIPIVLAPFCRATAKSGLAPENLDFLLSPYTFATNFDAIALGCAGAILLFHRREDVERALTSKAVLVASAALAAILIPYIMRGFLLGAVFTVPFGNTLQALGMATLILQSVLMPSFGFYRVLNWSAVAWVGVLSYSLYIWQQLFCSQPQWFGWNQVWWMGWPGWILATFAASVTSYYCLEKPFMRLRAKLR